MFFPALLFFSFWSTFARLVSWSVPSVEQKNNEKKCETALCAALLCRTSSETTDCQRKN